VESCDDGNQMSDVMLTAIYLRLVGDAKFKTIKLYVQNAALVVMFAHFPIH
jgi:hypothetical protein